MANLDTVSKRASGLNFLHPPTLQPPIPDGAIGAGDRQHIAMQYSGILAGVAVELEVVTGGGWAAPARTPNVIQSQGTAIRIKVAVVTRPGRVVPAFRPYVPVTVESSGTLLTVGVLVQARAGTVEPADDPDELRILGLL